MKMSELNDVALGVDPKDLNMANNTDPNQQQIQA